MADLYTHFEDADRQQVANDLGALKGVCPLVPSGPSKMACHFEFGTRGPTCVRQDAGEASQPTWPRRGPRDGYPILSQERNTTVTKRVKTAVLHPKGIQDEMKFPADVNCSQCSQIERSCRERRGRVRCRKGWELQAIGP